MWFLDDGPEESLFTDSEIALVDDLRRVAQTWSASGASSFVMRDDETGGVIAELRLSDGTGGLLDAYALILDGEARGGRSRTAVEESAGLRLDVRGDRDELLAAVAGWFEWLILRPVDRWEWWDDGTPYAMRCQFADTGEGLREAYSRHAAPPGQYESLVERGSFRGKGWIRTAGIGAPDHVYAVRRDGVSLPALSRPAYMWYECPLAS